MLTDVKPDGNIQYTEIVPKECPFSIELFNGLKIAQGERLAFILGPCALESRDHALKMAEEIFIICRKFGVGFIFKTSFDKANRSSIDSFRGIGLYNGLKILEEIRNMFEIPVTTDVHESHQCDMVAEVVDILQIPAFLCRQTDLLLAAAETGKPINVKKGQFVSSSDMKHVIEKIRSAHYSNHDQIILTERGVCHGYHDLVFDLRNIRAMRKFGYPVCADVTHSTQRMGGDKQSGGDSSLAPYLARAAIVCGVDLIFAEVHDDPANALSDGPCQIPLQHLESFLKSCLDARSIPSWEDKW